MLLNFDLRPPTRMALFKELVRYTFVVGSQKTAHTIAGIAGTALSLLTLGKIEKINSLANKTGFLWNYFPEVYYRSLNVIFPNRTVVTVYRGRTYHGYFTENIASHFYKTAVELTNAENKIKKHCFSRLLYLTGALLATITRTVDLAIGIFAAILSVFKFNQKINDLAYKNLSFPALISDVGHGIRAFINPFQNFNIYLPI